MSVIKSLAANKAPGYDKKTSPERQLWEQRTCDFQTGEQLI